MSKLQKFSTDKFDIYVVIAGTNYPLVIAGTNYPSNDINMTSSRSRTGVHE